MPKNLTAERKYVIESKADEWDGKVIKSIVRWYWSKKVEKMSEGEVLKQSKPLAWLNGGEK